MKPTAVVVSLAIAFNAACATFSIRSDRCPAYVPLTPPPGAVKVQYLGSGGYLVRRGDDVVLFGPVYSNPGLTEVGFDYTIRTDRALVDALLPADAAMAAAIVIGHGHYDHAMDTPYIAYKHATKANVYGSATLKNLIDSEVKSNRFVDVGPYTEPNAPRKFIPIGIGNDKRMRLWPIRSQHSDQTRVRPRILGIDFSGIDLPVHMWRGEVTAPRSTLPATASEWAEGEVYAYVLDFMNPTGTQVEFRVYYQDSGTDTPVGFPWRNNVPDDGRKIDVALICVGGDFENLKNHPEDIIRATEPRFLVLGHWENFFEPQTDICRTEKVDAIPKFEVKEFMWQAEKAIKENAKTKPSLKGKPILACPTASVFHFPTDTSTDAAIHAALKKPRATYDCSKILPRRP